MVAATPATYAATLNNPSRGPAGSGGGRTLNRMSHLPFLPLLAGAFGFADRFTGGGFPKLDAKLPGRSLFWGALLAGVLAYLGFGFAGLAVAAIWGAYRSLAFGSNTLNPVTGDEIKRTILRHVIVAPPVVFVAVGFHLSPLVAALAMAAYVAAAVGLAMHLGRVVKHAGDTGTLPKGDPNATVEALRGAAFGVAVWLLLASPT